MDTGSATVLAVQADADEWLSDPSSGVTRVDPKPSSIRRIKGIGALNMVEYWVQLTLDKVVASSLSQMYPSSVGIEALSLATISWDKDGFRYRTPLAIEVTAP